MLPPELWLLAGIVTAGILSMVVFALAGARTDRDASRKGAQLLLGSGDFLIHWFMWVLGPLERALLRARVSPETLNYLGLAFGAGSGVAIALGALPIGGYAIALGGACDVLDGRLARARKIESLFGKFLDSTLDRFVEVFAFLGFIVYLHDHSTGPFWAAAAMAGALLVSYTRARGESTGVICKGGLLQRAERIVLMCLVCVAERPAIRWLHWPPGRLVAWVMAAIAIGTLATAAYRTIWIAARLRRGESAGAGQ